MDSNSEGQVRDKGHKSLVQNRNGIKIVNILAQYHFHIQVQIQGKSHENQGVVKYLLC